MPLNKSSGNMYPWITHTWNAVKGACPHGCSYCYMNKIYRRFGKTPGPLHLDERELKTDLGSGNFIFAGSSTDIFSENIPASWIRRVLLKCGTAPNDYFFQTKNTERLYLLDVYLGCCTACVTLETNRNIYPVMGRSPLPGTRAHYFSLLHKPIKRMVTVEPVMDFDLPEFLEMIRICSPVQVNIGADSGNSHLPEPPKEKLLELIAELEKFTKVIIKKNLGRLTA